MGAFFICFFSNRLILFRFVTLKIEVDSGGRCGTPVGIAVQKTGYREQGTGNKV